MPNLGIVEDTLFIPLAGRIYASEHFPQILYDKKALLLKDQLPHDLFEKARHNQYTLLASAVRSANIDRQVKTFLNENPNGVIIQLGVGLETAFYRLNTKNVLWYAVDLPDVIELRRSLLGEPAHEKYIAADIFRDEWMKNISRLSPQKPLLITAAGLFHYFSEFEVKTFIKKIQHLHNMQSIDLVFDAVNKTGMKMLQKKYMKQMGHPHARMSFYVDSAQVFARQISLDPNTICEEAFYRHINKKGLHRSTKVAMMISDILGMVKILHARLN